MVMALSKISGEERLSIRVHRMLRSAILARRFAPGSKLVVRELAEWFQVSPTPVKEALATLAKEGLVRSLPRRGFFVQKLSPRDIREIYEVREAHEGLAASLAAPRMDRSSLSRLGRLLDRQIELVSSGDHEAYGDTDLAFHKVIWKASGNARLIEIADGLAGQVRLLISTSAAVPGRLERSLVEHQEIYRHMAERSPEQATVTMMRHIRNAGDDLYRYLKRMNPREPAEESTETSERAPRTAPEQGMREV